MSERPSKLTTQEFIRTAESVHRTHKGKFDLGKDKQGEVRITRAGTRKDIAVTIHSKDLEQRPFVEETEVHMQLGKRPQYSLTYDAREPDVEVSLSLTFEDGEVSDELVKSQTQILAKEVTGPERRVTDDRFAESVKEEVDRLVEIAEENHLLTTINTLTTEEDHQLIYRVAFGLDAQKHVSIEYVVSGPLEDPHHEMRVSLVAENGTEEDSPYHFDYTTNELTRIVTFDSKEIFFETSPQEQEELMEMLRSLGKDPRFPDEI